MSIAEDEDVSVLNKFHRRSVLAIEVGKSGSYRVLPILAGHISRTADIIALDMARLRCLDLEAYTIEDRSLDILERLVEYEVTVYIIDTREPQIGARFKRQFALIEGDRHIPNLVAQVDRPSAVCLQRVDIKRRRGRIGHREVININRCQYRIFARENSFVEALTEQETRGTARRSGVNGRDGHNALVEL